MRSAILAFAAGAACMQVQPVLPAPTILLACPGAAVLASLLLRGLSRMLVAGFLLGVCWAALCAHIALAEALPHKDKGRDITVTGISASLPHRFDGGARFQFDVQQVDTPDAAVPPRIIRRAGHRRPAGYWPR